MKKLVGQVTEDEKNEILTLFERKNGLSELVKVLSITNDEELYEKLIKDFSQTELRFQNWWKIMSEKYEWESHINGHWEIDFESNQIYLVY